MCPVQQDSSSGGNTGGTIWEFIRKLREAGGVPVNFIDSDEQVEINLPLQVGDMAAILDEAVAQTQSYRWRMIGGRYVVYPKDAVWESKVSGISITNVPRLEAATQYVAELHEQLPALEDLLPPVVLGDPRSPVYAESVSLRPEAAVVEHLVELLGSNEQLAFRIDRALSGRRILSFD